MSCAMTVSPYAYSQPQLCRALPRAYDHRRWREPSPVPAPHRPLATPPRSRTASTGSVRATLSRQPTRLHYADADAHRGAPSLVSIAPAPHPYYHQIYTPPVARSASFDSAHAPHGVPAQVPRPDAQRKTHRRPSDASSSQGSYVGYRMSPELRHYAAPHPSPMARHGSSSGSSHAGSHVGSYTGSSHAGSHVSSRPASPYAQLARTPSRAASSASHSRPPTPHAHGLARPPSRAASTTAHSRPPTPQACRPVGASLASTYRAPSREGERRPPAAAGLKERFGALFRRGRAASMSAVPH